MQLGTDLELAWSHPAATMATRKRIVRAVLHEIVVRVEGGFVDMVLHWQGGDHTPLKVKKNTTGKHRWTVEEDTEALVRELGACPRNGRTGQFLRELRIIASVKHELTLLRVPA